MQDPDNTVRETAGDALGQLAEHLYRQKSTLNVGDIACNPMLRAAYDTMLEHKKEVQQAGAYALSKVTYLLYCSGHVNAPHTSCHTRQQNHNVMVR